MIIFVGPRTTLRWEEVHPWTEYPVSVTDPVTIEVQPTPNINAMKFVVNRRLTEGKSRTFRTPEEAADAPLAKALLSIPGVVQVFFLNDFITITRDPKSDWEEIAGPAEDAVRGFFETTG